ncbi:unnamed protein product [Chironomus riparius]|uniref:Uncharacterized protein n=1 Tax=Chironomus riparius TaxID=315576 RepID=A0A9N9S3H2_9DIPT|nr:unnamed protein product [Chironomus riparius]
MLASKLLYGAEKYGLDKLKKICVDSMVENLSVENALEYFVLADRYNATYMLEMAALFIKKHHSDLSNDNEIWIKLSSNSKRKDVCFSTL